MRKSLGHRFLRELTQSLREGVEGATGTRRYRTSRKERRGPGGAVRRGRSDRPLRYLASNSSRTRCHIHHRRMSSPGDTSKEP
jgi:hypothetical protein